MDKEEYDEEMRRCAEFWSGMFRARRLEERRRSLICGVCVLLAALVVLAAWLING